MQNAIVYGKQNKACQFAILVDKREVWLADGFDRLATLCLWFQYLHLIYLLSGQTSSNGYQSNKEHYPNDNSRYSTPRYTTIIAWSILQRLHRLSVLKIFFLAHLEYHNIIMANLHYVSLYIDVEQVDCIFYHRFIIKSVFEN